MLRPGALATRGVKKSVGRLYKLDVAKVRGNDERRAAIGAAALDVGALLQERLAAFQVAFLARSVERGATVRGLLIDINLHHAEKERDYAVMPFLSSNPQRA